MKTNISMTNRLIRIAIGLLAITGALFMTSPFTPWVLALGIIILITAIIGFCPIDYYFHMKRRR